MGLLVDGKWTEDDQQVDSTGRYVRPGSAFRHQVTDDGSSGFVATPGRYHLFVAHSCPWAHRAIIVRRLKKLEDVISMTSADLPRTQGWAYSQGTDQFEPENGVLFLHKVYTAASPNYTGRVTVPVLWDRERLTIVNNESPDIIRMLNTAFDRWADRSVDLYPESLRREIDEVNGYIYERVNNGVYRAGLAKSQAAYEEAVGRLFEAFDWLEARLARQRFLAGSQITEADVRLFVTLVRFDAVYHYHFKCNLRRLDDYPNLSNYLRDLYQRPGFGDTVDLESIKRNYYSNVEINPNRIIPVGPLLNFGRPHDRGRFEQQHLATAQL